MKSKYKDIVFDSFRAAGFNEDLAALLTSQSAFETANWTSKLFLEQNNLNGMKEAKKRKTTDIDNGFFSAAAGTFEADKIGYSEYKNINEAAIDTRYYWESFKNPETFDSVAAFVACLKKAGYFEANESAYKTGVEYYYKLYFND